MSDFEPRAPLRSRKKAPETKLGWDIFAIAALTVAALVYFVQRHNSAPLLPDDEQQVGSSELAPLNDQTTDAERFATSEAVEPSIEPVERWEFFGPRSKEACLREGTGAFDDAFFACRRGGKKLIRVEDGREIVVRQVINDYSKVSPEDAAAAVERTKRWANTQREPARRTESRRNNPVLLAANSACDGYRYGTADYRQCRGRVWQNLRDQCHDLRGQLPFVGASQRDGHRRLTDDYCEAERKYEIID